MECKAFSHAQGLPGRICRGPALTRESALPADASCEDLEVDPSLSFLDGYVAEALGNGAAPYILQQDRFAMGVVRPSHHDEVWQITRASQAFIAQNHQVLILVEEHAEGGCNGQVPRLTASCNYLECVLFHYVLTLGQAITAMLF